MNRFLIVTVVLLSLSIGVSAQGSVKRKSKTVPDRLSLPVDDYAVPAASEVVVHINFGKNQVASVEIKSDGESGMLTNDLLSSVLQHLSKSPAHKSATNKSVRFDPVFVFKPDLSQSPADIIDVVNTVRNSTENNVIVDLGAGLKLFVKRKAKVSDPLQPNPLFLLVSVGTDNKITLNGEGEGTTADLNKLKGHLSDVFRARALNGVYRVGSNTVDTTVNLSVSESTEFAEIQRLALAVSAAGADRIFLLFDREDVDRKELIMNVEAVPVKR